MNVKWWPVYLAHGQQIDTERIGHTRAARLFGLGLNEARRLVYYVRINGPPEHNSPPHPREQTQEVDKPVDAQPSLGRTHLVIGDAHAGPGQDLRRFLWLAEFCLEHRPDVVMSIGDWFGMDALCKHHSAAEAEGQRLLADLEAGNRALQLLGERLQRHNQECPDDLYSPRLVVTLGNHDWRIMREAQEHPHLYGILNTDLMDWESWGWEVVPYTEPIDIDGIRYCHHFSRPGSRRPISGMHHAAALVREGLGTSLVCGHSHQLQWHHKAGHDGRRVHGLVAGCYFEHHEDYAGTSNESWWRGLCLLLNVNNGDFDLETWHMSRLEARYGLYRSQDAG